MIMIVIMIIIVTHIFWKCLMLTQIFKGIVKFTSIDSIILLQPPVSRIQGIPVKLPLPS